jgi:ATP-dependent Lon protease
MNGLWANAIGQGGVIPIQAMYFPTHNFLEMKLTGLQGDVMKESMNVAKSLAFFLTKPETRNKLIDEFKTTQIQGLHIHCPEGAIQKDGPSAGAAITVAIYSLLNNLPIPNTIGMTGEINLQGQITAIGGLELKILGGIKAGIKHFLFPKENERDYNKFVKKYKDDKQNILDGIHFTMVESIREVLDIVFNKNGDIFDIYNY